MSTNIKPHTGLPDIAELEALANSIFKELPQEVPKQISLNPEDHPRAKAFVNGVLNGSENTAIDHTIVKSLAVPKSAEGLGTTAAVTEYVPLINNQELSALEKGENAPFETISNNGGRISVPVSGSGVSPSYLTQGENFNINNPETGFPDSNINKNTPVQNVPVDDWGIPNTYWTNIEDILKHLPGLGEYNTTPPAFKNTKEHLSPEFYFINNRLTTLPNTKNKFHTGIDVNLVRKDFPILTEKVNGHPLIWFDNAATTQKPAAVKERIAYFYDHENSNIHRAAHELAARATDAYEAAREKVRAFIGARSVNEIIFVRGTTEGINLVASSWGEQYLKPGDEIIVSNLEHHANIVPWKRLADKKGIKLKVIPVDDDGQIIVDAYNKLLTENTKLVAVTQVSNALGTVTPVQQITAMAHAVGAKVLIDGAQSVSHMAVNVQTIEADWFVFSGHKIFGPTGIGVVYGKEALLNTTQPYQGGGNMIQDVTFEEIKYHNTPNRFEAGTGNIADAVGLGAAIDYVTKIGIENIGTYEHYLLEYATGLIQQIPGIRIIGTAAKKASVLSFTLQGYTNDEVGKALNDEGIAVRTGHHCAQPILRRMGVETTVRPSLAFYNTTEEVDIFIEVLKKLRTNK